MTIDTNTIYLYGLITAIVIFLGIAVLFFLLGFGYISLTTWSTQTLDKRNMAKFTNLLLQNRLVTRFRLKLNGWLIDWLISYSFSIQWLFLSLSLSLSLFFCYCCRFVEKEKKTNNLAPTTFFFFSLHFHLSIVNKTKWKTPLLLLLSLL